MPLGSTERSTLDAFSRVDELPGFATLTVQQQCDFLRRYHVGLARTLKAHRTAVSHEQRERVIDDFRATTEALAAEVQTIVERLATSATDHRYVLETTAVDR